MFGCVECYGGNCSSDIVNDAAMTRLLSWKLLDLLVYWADIHVWTKEVDVIAR